MEKRRDLLTCDGAHGVGDDNTVLDVEPLDLGEGTSVSAVGGEELSDNGEGLGGVDGLVGAVEGSVAHTVGVEVASIGVTEASVSVAGRGSSTTLVTSALSRTASTRARVRGVGGGNRVGLPEIHLVAAGSVVTGSSVGGVGVTSPADVVGLWR